MHTSKYHFVEYAANCPDIDFVRKHIFDTPDKLWGSITGGTHRIFRRLRAARRAFDGETEIADFSNK